MFRAHEVGYFLYIGGNDSMDTANKIAALARQRGLDLVAVGVPKTIDNDVGDSEFRLIDHTPGYGSTARYWMHAVQNANEENAGSSPGRSGAGDAGDGAEDRLHSRRRPGWPTRTARCRCRFTWRKGPARSTQLADQVNDLLRRRGRAMVVVSEGFDVGDLGDVQDSFGHTNVRRQRRRPSRKWW